MEMNQREGPTQFQTFLHLHFKEKLGSLRNNTVANTHYTYW